MKKIARPLVLAPLAFLGVLTLTAPASAATPYCGLTWGSTAEAGPTAHATGAELEAVRTGQHACFDRIVLSLRNGSSDLAYTVGYGPVRGVASGDLVPVAGGASLRISVLADGTDLPLGDPRQLAAVDGYRTFRQVVWAGSQEGETVIGLGTRARLPFRTFLLAGPTRLETRLVVDVAHAW
ncbi:hypothetical protein E9549_18695 [Blastococcus sp. MG754426]|uniref:AMIN-like domain-containing (lipo)protein n=1 Tax=unclassified Blastococcus TaxID=2619396 RepID=UPI001EF027F3|nr:MULTISPECIES: hypothetical protein [unclassified Blastococcus]MCF6509416.1 hypothetical protein [Blastococcus sp. MG754426]MCF6513909.1 hypothetical protein [Blastococcus sp. MG754427]